MPRGCASKKIAKVTLWISVAFFILSAVLLLSFQSIYDAVLKTYITLGKGSLVTKIWEDIPLPIYERLYFFNITNREAFLEGSEPLNVTEVGPYTFQSRWIKKHPHWNANYTVSYRELRTYHFVPELSNGTEDDIIYTLNGPMIIGANVVPAIARPGFVIYCLLKGETPVTIKSIRELAYQGYEDAIISHARIFKPDIPYRDGKFSWLYGKNHSDDGLFTVFTGTDDESKTDIINKWNGKETLAFWKGNTCNMINGTSIETGPPIKGLQESYTFFQSIFCRSVTFNYVNDTNHYNILSKRFRPKYNLFANSTENPDNRCFEVKKERPSGVLDISSCQFGSPVLISFPHFYMADSSYLDSVNGLNPSDEKHGSHIDIEPVTGISIDLTVRFQVNLEVHQITAFPQFSTLTEGIFPVFWAELSLKIDEDLANFLKTSVHNPKIIAYSTLGALAIVNLLAGTLSIVYLYTSKEEDDDDPLIDAINNKTPFPEENDDCSQHNEITSAKKEKDDDKCVKNNEACAILCPNEDSEASGMKSPESAIMHEVSAINKTLI